jgi:hypothetical protein
MPLGKFARNGQGVKFCRNYNPVLSSVFCEFQPLYSVHFNIVGSRLLLPAAVLLLLQRQVLCITSVKQMVLIANV